MYIPRRQRFTEIVYMGGPVIAFAFLIVLLLPGIGETAQLIAVVVFWFAWTLFYSIWVKPRIIDIFRPEEESNMDNSESSTA